MIAILLFIGIAFADNVILCMDETSDKCQHAIEVSNLASGKDNAKCVLYGDGKTIKVYSSSTSETPDANTDGDADDNKKEGVKKDTTIEYHIEYFTDKTCGTKEKDETVKKLENKPENIVITVTLKETPSETAKEGSENTYVEYIVGGVCINKKIYVQTQFGVGEHQCDDNGEIGNLANIITDKYNGQECRTEKINVGNNKYTTDKDKDIQEVQEVKTEYSIEAKAKIVEITSEEGGYIYTCETVEQSVICKKGDEVVRIKEGEAIAEGVKCNDKNGEVECQDSNVKVYFFSKCQEKKKFTIAGSYFQELKYSDEECKTVESIEATSSNNSNRIKCGDTTYAVTYEKQEEEGIIYSKTSNIEYKSYKVNKCNKGSETSSKKVVKTRDNTYIIEEFSDKECEEPTSVENIGDISTEVPVSGATVIRIESDVECSVSKKEEAVFGTYIKVDSCDDKMKYVILNNTVIKYEYSSGEECSNNGEGEANEKKYGCGKCEDKVKTICPGNTPSGDTSDNNDDSASSMMIGILSVIALFFF
ncbi:hypothetical protein CL6EHI_075310 [Entamoeba histolytica]|uniref:Uncharacterized protein n=2 Tax=Entamoeba histolytica TaxID=5759 RepID=C4MBS2_ENTH1|nr:hypothetical protein EHI_075310 [Entamoeba histolytica HM-1:IMSS]EAL42934.1 hypothetical protein EHI_075310 [Entamoeba histolytica HM-1:IMSS]GAT99596.1 hypothetical protein CL6EHI_075310 [Entamoeba histolytica]|eukprot:XP_648321.1 hypothetical protein EHI_075310 [Entamoeba histolytica HM-1:IMSS]